MFSRCPIGIARIAVGAIAAMVFTFAVPARAQDFGHSYMQLKIGGNPITNVPMDEKYAGWLRIDTIRAIPTPPKSTAASGEAEPGDAAIKTKKMNAHWDKLSAMIHSGRAGAGRMRFSVGDYGGLQPVVDAQKHKSLLASAEIDLYEEDGGAFIGKYRLKGIRVLSLEDVPASACPMYVITMSFQSVEKIQSSPQTHAPTQP